MSFPWDLSPRFARYYRDPHGVEFRDLMKAYGIRFDVIVNGKVCGSSSLSTAWWLPGQGDWRAPPGIRAVHPALLVGLSHRRENSASSPQSSTLVLGWRSWVL